MVLGTSSPLVWGSISSPLQFHHFHWVLLVTHPVVPSSLRFLSVQAAGSLLPGPALFPFDFIASFLPESIVPASSRRLTLKQSLPPAVTTVALSLKFSSGFPHRCHRIPKECCIHNSMDVYLTSGSASPLHMQPPMELRHCYLLSLKQILHNDLFDSGDSTLEILCFQKSFLILPCLPCLLVSPACLAFMGHCLLLKAHSQCL